jgi:aldose 1-epimerase
MPAGQRIPSVTRASFGVLPAGERVDSFALVSARGLEMRVITLGGVITSLRIPDREGCLDDVVLGHDTLAGYVAASPYFGALVGRYANRIALGRFTLDGIEHRLATNDGPHHLHGGVRGFDKVVWTAEPLEEQGAVGVRLSYESADGEEGYPGALSARVVYRLTEDDALEVEYAATTTRATPVNLTQHSYWNLAGSRAPTILDHELTIHADSFTPVDAGLIPTGEVRPVAETAFDFRTAARVGAHVDDQDVQLRHAGGYDHNFVLRAAGPAELRPAARLRDPLSGRTLDVHTTEPGLQFYSGNFLDGSIRGKGGRAYVHRGGLCLETQHFPDSPNRPAFPSTILRPGEWYRSRARLAFSTG